MRNITKIKFFTISAAVIVFYISLFPTVSSNSSMPVLLPEAYSDSYAYIDGNPAKAGANITVRSTLDNKIVGSGVVVDDSGIFSVDIILDDPLTVEDEGADNFELVKWCINDIEAFSPAPGEDKAESGKLNIRQKVYINTSSGYVSCLRETRKGEEINKVPFTSNLIYKAVILTLVLIIFVLVYIIFKIKKHKA